MRNYSFVVINTESYTNWKGGVNTFILPKGFSGSISGVATVNGTEYLRNWGRNITINDDGITMSTSYSHSHYDTNVSSSDAYGIPIAIYGIR